MYKSILVGTDGSDTADCALARAMEIARLTEAQLHVVSAYSASPARVAGGATTAEATEWSVGSDFKVEAVLERATERAREEGVKIKEHSLKGDPGDAIVTLAKDLEADLIVLGSRGMQGARRVLGSVPNKVSHHAPCDVLIVQTG